MEAMALLTHCQFLTMNGIADAAQLSEWISCRAGPGQGAGWATGIRVTIDSLGAAPTPMGTHLGRVAGAESCAIGWGRSPQCQSVGLPLSLVCSYKQGESFLLFIYSCVNCASPTVVAGSSFDPTSIDNRPRAARLLPGSRSGSSSRCHCRLQPRSWAGIIPDI